MSLFSSLWAQMDGASMSASILAKTPRAVERALLKNKLDLEDFKALISPAAAPYLENMAQKSAAKTRKRFGQTIKLFAPLYLSNHCHNICTYCGFSVDRPMKRLALQGDDLIQEAKAVAAMGIKHVLLVTGESRQFGLSYLLESIEAIRPLFSSISIETQPFDLAGYQALKAASVQGVSLYQETYDAKTYQTYHLKGLKSHMKMRLDAPDLFAAAGIDKLGLGVLWGLNKDWRLEALMLATHLLYLNKRYWKSTLSISFPRLKAAFGVEDSLIPPDQYLSDAAWVQMICAFRLLDSHWELTLSTRESPKMRANLLPLGFTQMSAGSLTAPGQYAQIASDSLAQFEISDKRLPREVAHWLKTQGFDPVWKDWDIGLDGT